MLFNSRRCGDLTKRLTTHLSSKRGFSCTWHRPLAVTREMTNYERLPIFHFHFDFLLHTKIFSECSKPSNHIALSFNHVSEIALEFETFICSDCSVHTSKESLYVSRMLDAKKTRKLFGNWALAYRIDCASVFIHLQNDVKLVRQRESVGPPLPWKETKVYYRRTHTYFH